MLLADLGADVIRVRRPSHRAARPLTQTIGLTPEQDVVNRGTSSVAIDLKDPAGLEDLKRLVDSADVFMEGYRPGVAERLGIGPDVLRERNPKLVYARITGYGQTGPLAQIAGHDINYVAQSGALHAMGGPTWQPRPPVNYLGDYAGGGSIGALGIVSALYEVRSSGLGQTIDIAMLDGVALLTAKTQGLRGVGLFSDEPGTNFVDCGAPFYDTYKCADGRYVAIAPLEADFYAEFLRVLGVDGNHWPDRDDREQWPELRRLIEETFAGRTMDEWTELFDGTDACVSPVLTFDEAAQHPHNVERSLYVDVDGVAQPAPAPRLSRTPGRTPGEQPREGLDVDTLLGARHGHAHSHS
jgi:alpha-methylacyl-CoA racemase